MKKNNTAISSATPQVLGLVDTKAPTTNSSEQSITYTYIIQPGDTLFSISKRPDVNVSWTILAELNKLKAPFALRPGQTIKIPKQ